MNSLKVPISVVEGFAPQRLAVELGVSVGEAIGHLVWFLASTRRAKLEQGDWRTLERHVLDPKHAAEIAAALADLGVLKKDELGKFWVVPNLGMRAQSAAAAERVKLARAALSKKRVAKKKAKPEAAPVADQGELVVSADQGTARVQKVTDHALELRRQAWATYSNAYMQTTGQPPLDNMKQRSLIMHFCKHVGADAPAVLDFYCRHPNRKYITAVYPLTMAVADATGLHTQWRNGSYVTYEGAKSAGFDAEFLHRMGQLDQEYAQLPPEA